jgi:hypothetical protein
MLEQVKFGQKNKSKNKQLSNKEQMTMTIFNEHFFPIMKKHIEELQTASKDNNFRTVDLIKQYLKHYHVDKTNAHDSINANIGKYLSENASALGIKEIASNQPCVDDDENPSQTSVWEFV